MVRGSSPRAWCAGLGATCALVWLGSLPPLLHLGRRAGVASRYEAGARRRESPLCCCYVREVRKGAARYAMLHTLRRPLARAVASRGVPPSGSAGSTVRVGRRRRGSTMTTFVRGGPSPSGLAPRVGWGCMWSRAIKAYSTSLGERFRVCSSVRRRVNAAGGESRKGG